MSEYKIVNGETRLTRAQRRRLDKVSARVDKITRADRKFFERHPNRRHRVRVAHYAEIEQGELVCGDSVEELADGMIYFAAVKNIKTGVRLRLFFHADEMLDTDLSEDAVFYIFEQLRPPDLTVEFEQEFAHILEGER